jgi:hypothetical protein
MTPDISLSFALLVCEMRREPEHACMRQTWLHRNDDPARVRHGQRGVEKKKREQGLVLMRFMNGATTVCIDRIKTMGKRGRGKGRRARTHDMVDLSVKRIRRVDGLASSEPFAAKRYPSENENARAHTRPLSFLAWGPRGEHPPLSPAELSTMIQ